jgi:hypothetical protein
MVATFLEYCSHLFPELTHLDSREADTHSRSNRQNRYPRIMQLANWGLIAESVFGLLAY